MRLPYKVLTVGIAVGVGVGGCSMDAPADPAERAENGSAAATAVRGGELNALTARGVVEALDREGFPVPHPVDTTKYECPDAGCDQSIVTDSVRVKSFSSTGRAQKFAARQGLFQAGTVVVAFAPPVPPAERARFRGQIQLLVR